MRQRRDPNDPFSDPFFDGHHARVKQMRADAVKTIKFSLTVFAFWFVICLGFAGGLLYVAWHFLSKVW